MTWKRGEEIRSLYRGGLADDDPQSQYLNTANKDGEKWGKRVAKELHQRNEPIIYEIAEAKKSGSAEDKQRLIETVAKELMHLFPYGGDPLDHEEKTLVYEWYCGFYYGIIVYVGHNILGIKGKIR